MKSIVLSLFTVSLILSVAGEPPQRVQAPQSSARQTNPEIPNGKIDYRTYLKIAQATEATRAARRLTEIQFAEMAAEKGTVVLDARSADKYAMRHIQGAVSLPFTDFTTESLAKVIPAKDTRILIYCNNNFDGDQLAFAAKSAAASLNISTFVALVTYGYTNVYELGPLLNVKTTRLRFEGTAVSK